MLWALFYFLPLIPALAYALFVSTLIVTIRSDSETMLISRYMTLYAIPLALICIGLGYIPHMTLFASLVGSASGWILLWIIATTYRLLKGIDGMGDGDRELLAYIGAWIGLQGVLSSLFIGALLGSLYGIGALILSRASLTTRIPFGPFLALGAFISIIAPRCVLCLC
jgi:leader peptidase (prepilin peptidase)/N-methyltransferase